MAGLEGFCPQCFRQPLIRDQLETEKTMQGFLNEHSRLVHVREEGADFTEMAAASSK